MTQVMDFLRASLPWIAIGLFAAVNAVILNDRRNNKKRPVLFSVSSAITLLCFMFVAGVELVERDITSALTYVVLGMATYGISILNSRGRKTE